MQVDFDSLKFEVPAALVFIVLVTILSLLRFFTTFLFVLNSGFRRTLTALGDTYMTFQVGFTATVWRVALI